MTNQQILEKAIQKAIDGGWKYPFGANTYEIHKYVKARPESIAFGLREEWQDEDDPGHLEGHWSIQELIFNHDFAKALWSDKFINPEMRDDTGSKVIAMKQTAWKHHLRQMVTAENPLEYLKENL